MTLLWQNLAKCVAFDFRLYVRHFHLQLPYVHDCYTSNNVIVILLIHVFNRPSLFYYLLVLHFYTSAIVEKFGHRFIWVRRCADYLLGAKVKGQCHNS